MNIYIDEAGSFVHGAEPHLWCAVASYVVPEKDENRADGILTRLKDGLVANGDEVKINVLTEIHFANFLRQLDELQATFHVVATDSSMNSPEVVKSHQQTQGLLIVQHLDKMKYEEGRRALTALRDRVDRLSPQLYVQMSCQLILMFRTVHTMIPYYAQRDPTNLSRFRWRVDQKNLTKTLFEEAFEILGPAILQTLSFSDPLMMIEGLDYTPMQHLLYSKESAPSYLRETYGIDTGEGGVNIQKLIRDDIDFVDSKSLTGIQIADLLVSGLRKCLRLQWQDNLQIAHAIGRLMVQAKPGDLPIQLVSLSQTVSVGKKVTALVKTMARAARPFIDHSLRSRVKKTSS